MLYAVKQRVCVPGQQAEAVIMDATETIPGFPVYTLKFLNDGGENECGTVGEGDLHEANPTDADILAAAQKRSADEAAIDDLVRLRAREQVARIMRDRRRKPAKKSAKRRR